MIGRRSLELKTAPQLQAMQRAGVVLSEALDATLAAAAPVSYTHLTLPTIYSV